MVIKTAYHFVDSNLRVEILKEWLTEKQGCLEVVLPGRGVNDLRFGRICLGDER